MTQETKDILLAQGNPTTGAAIKSSFVTKSNTKTLTDPYRLDISLTQAGANQMIEALQSLQGSENGTKLSIHFGKKETQTGKSFNSVFMFIRPIAEAQAGAAPQKKFQPKLGAEKAAKVAKTLG